jgi:hypothetical protein
MDSLEKRTVVQIVASILFAGTYRLSRQRRRSNGSIPTGRAAARPRLTYWTGATVALVGPAALVARAASEQPVRVVAPPSWVGKLALLVYVSTGAAAEEFCWRFPLTLPMRGRPLALVAAMSGTSFVAAHLPNDGRRGVPAHLVNTMAWTTSAILTRSARWTFVSHCAYNLVSRAGDSRHKSAE